MEWTHYISYFFGGAFLTNAVPHFVRGVIGQPFQSPFRKAARRRTLLFDCQCMVGVLQHGGCLYAAVPRRAL